MFGLLSSILKNVFWDNMPALLSSVLSLLAATSLVSVQNQEAQVLYTACSGSLEKNKRHQNVLWIFFFQIHKLSFWTLVLKIRVQTSHVWSALFSQIKHAQSDVCFQSFSTLPSLSLQKEVQASDVCPSSLPLSGVISWVLSQLKIYWKTKYVLGLLSPSQKFGRA